MKAYLSPQPSGIILLRAERYIDHALEPELAQKWRRAIDGAVWVQKIKRHTLRPDQVVGVVARLESAGFEVVVNKLLRPLLTFEVEEAAARIVEARETADEMDAGYRERGLTLFGFQKNVIEFLASRNIAINALDTGLGKTPTSIAALPYGAAVLVICPLEARDGTWPREFKEWRPDFVPTVIEQRKDFRLPAAHEAIIINFDILPECPVGALPAPLFVIVDEIHKVKDPKSARSRRVRSYNVRASRAIGLSGTPLPKDPDDLWGVLSCFGLEHEVFGTKTRFRELFRGLRTYFWVQEPVVDDVGKEVLAPCAVCDGSGSLGEGEEAFPCISCKGSGVGDKPLTRRVPKPGAQLWGVCPTNMPLDRNKPWELPETACRSHEQRLPDAPTPDGPPCPTCNGIWPMDPSPEIPELLRRVMIRFEKKDVLKDLPAIIYKVLHVPLTKKQIKTLENEVGWAEIDALLACEDISQVVEGPGLMRGRKLLAGMKIDFCSRILDEWEADNVTSLVFSAHRDPILEFEKRVGWTAIHGTTTESRGDIEKAFQAGEYRGLAAIISAASTALTLTRATRELFVDRAFNPSDNDQAEARAHRIGQTAGLLVYDAVADHPIDRHVHVLCMRKRQIINATIGKMAGYQNVDLPLIRAIHRAGPDKKSP